MLKTSLHLPNVINEGGKNTLDTRATTSGNIKIDSTTKTDVETGTSAATTSRKASLDDSNHTVDVKGEEGTVNTKIIDTTLKSDTGVQSGVGI